MLAFGPHRASGPMAGSACLRRGTSGWIFSTEFSAGLSSSFACSLHDRRSRWLSGRVGPVDGIRRPALRSILPGLEHQLRLADVERNFLRCCAGLQCGRVAPYAPGWRLRRYGDARLPSRAGMAGLASRKCSNRRGCSRTFGRRLPADRRCRADRLGAVPRAEGPWSLPRRRLLAR